MLDTTIVLLVPPPEPAPPPTSFTIPTLITRYKTHYPNQRTLNRQLAEETAIRLADAARNWYHATDMFASFQAGSRLAHFRMEWMKMATRNGRTRNWTSEKPEWKGFLERPLTEAEMTILDDWKPKPAELFELVHRTLEDGYNISLSYSQKLKSSTCTLKDENPDRTTSGYALSSHDANGYDALKMAMYKHHSALEADWRPLTGAPPKARRG